eukprot:TRINITY_DN11464_c0_g1_i4.p1 TRINITY_DN11464_c0_g1~~TRINITY_DN11464_c0_g1_i4.p1  ORF type:complete len:218 (-),score=29.06 TRINITY_DN11464_c0_g1_i4:115-768(-)
MEDNTISKEETKTVNIDELLESGNSYNESESSNGSPSCSDHVGLPVKQQVSWASANFLSPSFNGKGVLNPIIEDPSKEDGSYDSNNSCVKVNPFMKNEQLKTPTTADVSTACPSSPLLVENQTMSQTSVAVPNDTQQPTSTLGSSVAKSQTLQYEFKTDGTRKIVPETEAKTINLQSKSQTSVSTKRSIKKLQYSANEIQIDSNPSCTNANCACIIV